MNAPMSMVSVDAVALRGTDQGTQILVHRRVAEPFAGHWALPGVLLGGGERVTAAAIRATSKAGVAGNTVRGAGQLAVFDEPNRDPRGPTLSIAMWVAPELGFEPDPEVALWVMWDQLPELAFDHGRILDDVRPILAAKLWADRAFTEALTGPAFSVRKAIAITQSLTGEVPDRGNLNRTLKRIAVTTGEKDTTTGRPGAVWRWR